MRVSPAVVVTLFLVVLPAFASTPPPADADAPALLAVGIELHESGAYDDAIAVYRRVLEADPSNVEARYEMALSTFGKGAYLDAVGMLDAVIASAGTPPQGTWLLLGMSHAMLGHWALAESTFRRGLERAPRDPSLSFHLAISLASQGRFMPAIDAFEGCLRDYPYRADAWRSLGDALYESGAKGRALRYRRVVAV